MAENQTFHPIPLGELCDALAPISPTLLLCHTRPDGDTLGSAMALSLLLRAIGSETYLVCADELPKRLSFLKTFYPYQESISAENLPEGFVPSRIVSVDVASPAQAGALWEIYGVKTNLMIDHHGRGTPFTDYHTRPDASATGEIVFDIAEEMMSRGLVPERPAGMDACLYAAISSDTGCFRYSNVTPETHQIAAELLKSGLNAADINRLLFEVKTEAQMRVEECAMREMRHYLGGKAALVAVPYSLKKKLGVADTDLETLVDVARSAEGIEVGISIRQPDRSGNFRVSMRSVGEVDVSAICAVFGGGGHKKAAGCSVSAKNIRKAMQAVLDAVEKEMQK